MYLTQLDTLSQQLKTDLFNHKRFRPVVYYESQMIRHLLFPDIPKYIFNFFFDSEQKIIPDSHYTIDVLCQQKYGDSYAYPLITFINGNTGIQDFVKDLQIFLPNELISFVNEYADVYTDDKVESPVEPPLEFIEDELGLNSVPSYVDIIAQKFGSLFVEA